MLNYGLQSIGKSSGHQNKKTERKIFSRLRTFSSQNFCVLFIKTSVIGRNWSTSCTVTMYKLTPESSGSRVNSRICTKFCDGAKCKQVIFRHWQNVLHPFLPGFYKERFFCLDAICQHGKKRIRNFILLHTYFLDIQDYVWFIYVQN